jgi:DNA invertase Pin-like site-specific DNA recombinase
MDLVAYLRISSETQLDGFGLDVQRQAIAAWTRHGGHRLIGEHVDAGVSGTKDAMDRPGLSAALDMLRPPPRACGLLVARFDRLARRLDVQEAILAVAWRAGATVFTVDGGKVLPDDPDDPMRTLIRQVMGGVAQFERSLVEKRLRDGRRAKADLGMHAVGQHRYGYRSGGRGQDRLPHEEEQGVVTRILTLRQLGHSYREIASALDAEGLAPRRATRWSAMTVRNVHLHGAGGSA